MGNASVVLKKTTCVNYHLVIIYTTMKDNDYSREDETLATLLNLDGEIFPMDSGYWTKFEAYRVNPEPHISHGVRYSLTLHDRYNRRVFLIRQRPCREAGKEGIRRPEDHLGSQAQTRYDIAL
jgi:hypothetical protein